MKRVIVLAPSRDVENSLRSAAEAAGFDSDGQPLPPEFCSALYRDPDAIGVIRATYSSFAAVTCRNFRKADVRNILFVLLDKQEAHPSSMSLILRCGADDVQPAPIDRDEFMARLKMLARRGVYNDHLMIQMPGCVLDAETGNVEGGGKKQHLTTSEAKVMMALAREPERALSKDELMDRLYGGEDEPERKIIDVLICKLRRKLAQMNGGLDVVETVWGRGYRFVPKGFEPKYRKDVRAPR
ncbi:winged helix-turn-helix domain-containing protein [Aminobacter aminovorans]|uniref:Chemotaxis protein CheY n=1 Tax=Aminobacter aminovorans TaxID=83263 RepID=A0AAC9FDJ9_AMIAI|nr:response regulator transcription factor [Aminobacter aminovorans]AMS41190.1 Chemotaxis protein CheY [Aminobacter aminovorans]MBB3705827.1 two-component system cell cycle response regulator CtrA [Aminobacter aminovorans]